MGTSGAQTRTGGDFKARKVSGSSVICAQISAAALPVMQASSTMTARPVFRTERRMAGVSIGTSVRGSTTSNEMPSASNSSAAFSASRTIFEMATTVTSDPSRFTSASPMGITYSSSGTGNRSGRAARIWSSKNTTGLLSRMALFIRPLAS